MSRDSYDKNADFLKHFLEEAEKKYNRTNFNKIKETQKTKLHTKEININ